MNGANWGDVPPERHGLATGPATAADPVRGAVSAGGSGTRLARSLRTRREQVAQRWADAALFQTVYVASRDTAVRAAQGLVDALADVADSGRLADTGAAGFDPVRGPLADMVQARRNAGVSTSQVHAEVTELGRAVLWAVRSEDAQPGAAGLSSDGHLAGQGVAGPADPHEAGQDAVVAAMELMGTLRLVVAEAASAADAGIIARQRQELLETSTPVLKLWEGVLAVPLVGVLDSARGQVVMESLLEGIVEQRARVAILDITGVPMVDTVVAQHLMKTAAAVRLMGSACVISGIRPQIAQTIAALGIDLGEIRTQASLADALAWALARLGAQDRAAAETTASTRVRR
ncbi:STAS domain-containing protein [Actinomadura opuntiae]|uniref:STAS domain-containing protein n=1 Tax=Actinomadura sp. OS1-43 TaxID=604315 RepID=UPI00255A829F|nr:STAS domain-containing protein [Actinomadura sp. OS1-43]MDL4814435.1 STAS domain-containing protein [Actinomadura sp. OS1-43]